MTRRYLPLDKCASGGPLKECWDLAQTIFFAITDDQAIRITGDFPDIAPRPRTRVINKRGWALRQRNLDGMKHLLRSTSFSGPGWRRMCIRDMITKVTARRELD